MQDKKTSYCFELKSTMYNVEELEEDNIVHKKLEVFLTHSSTAKRKTNVYKDIGYWPWTQARRQDSVTGGSINKFLGGAREVYFV